MNFKEPIRVLGRFEIGCKMRITDPCYEANIRCAGSIDAVAGIWEAGVLEFDGTIAVLAVRHENSPLPLTAETVNTGADARSIEGNTPWMMPTFRACIDSGQAGLFDDAEYKARGGRADDAWYSKICNMTCGPALGGVLVDGAVTRAGYGDGSYVCVYHRNEDGLADFVFLMFMDDEGNEDW